MSKIVINPSEWLAAEIKKHQDALDRLYTARDVFDEMAAAKRTEEKKELADLLGSSKPGNVVLTPGASQSGYTAHVVPGDKPKPVYKKISNNGPVDWKNLQKDIIDCLLDGPMNSAGIISRLKMTSPKQKQAVYNIVSQMVKQKHAFRDDNGILTLGEHVAR